MTLSEAYYILEVDEDETYYWVKANYRWLMWFYHPDTKMASNVREYMRVREAYRIIKEYKGYP